METLNFTDMFQKSFLALSMSSADRLSPFEILINLLISFLTALFIFFVYKRTYQGVLYQRSFNISLVITSTVTSLVIMTISGNLILSLGMVGALSIVRFRTPIKDSIDLAFLFWAITTGIANGVGYYNISVIGSALVSIFIISLTKNKKSLNEFILIINAKSKNNEDVINRILSENCSKHRLMSVSYSSQHIEYIHEIKLRGESNIHFLSDLNEIDSVSTATMVSASNDQ